MGNTASSPLVMKLASTKNKKYVQYSQDSKDIGHPVFIEYWRMRTQESLLNCLDHRPLEKGDCYLSLSAAATREFNSGFLER